jgi:hypothetical protein
VDELTDAVGGALTKAGVGVTAAATSIYAAAREQSRTHAAKELLHRADLADEMVRNYRENHRLPTREQIAELGGIDPHGPAAARYTNTQIGEHWRKDFVESLSKDHTTTSKYRAAAREALAANKREATLRQQEPSTTTDGGQAPQTAPKAPSGNEGKR